MNRKLDTLRVKLFVAIAGANVLLVMAAYLIYGWSFEQSLGDYLAQTEERRLDPVVARLADGYRQHGGWGWLTTDRRLWPELLREELGAAGRRRDERRFDDARLDERRFDPAPDDAPGLDERRVDERLGEPRSSEPHDGDVRGAERRETERPVLPPDALLPPLTMDPRLILFDGDGTVLVGSAERAHEAVRKDIAVDGRVVGYLGYIPRLQMVASLERVFSAQLGQRFAVIAVGMLVAVLATAALIASWLSQRLSALSHGAAALTHGDYATRLAVDGNDELARLAGDFNRLAAALEDAQRARQQWVADIAHELRTPLATLRAELEALEDGVRPLSAACVSSLVQEVGQLTRLVEDLRLLSLSDLGALTYRKEPIVLAESIEDSLGATEHGGLRVELDLDRNAVVLADANRLAQVFANMLQNTLRYTDVPGRLRIVSRTIGDEVEVRWEDSAPGVPAEDLPRLTDRLFRVDDSRARTSGGSGLGLAIVKAIVDAHGGSLQASPSPLGGLCWTLTLPLAARTGANG